MCVCLRCVSGLWTCVGLERSLVLCCGSDLLYFRRSRGRRRLFVGRYSMTGWFLCVIGVGLVHFVRVVETRLESRSGN